METILLLSIVSTFLASMFEMFTGFSISTVLIPSIHTFLLFGKACSRYSISSYRNPAQLYRGKAGSEDTSWSYCMKKAVLGGMYGFPSGLSGIGER
ncbi:MAG: hypothetical protein ACOCTR_00645 [Candidatus Natronoplasma sp.]